MFNQPMEIFFEDQEIWYRDFVKICNNYGKSPIITLLLIDSKCKVIMVN